MSFLHQRGVDVEGMAFKSKSVLPLIDYGDTRPFDLVYRLEGVQGRFNARLLAKSECDAIKRLERHVGITDVVLVAASESR